MAGDVLKILVNSSAKMSRGKYAAQAVHAALEAMGVHHGGPVIVLGASREEILSTCGTWITDAGLTEVPPGTVTAGVLETPTRRGCCGCC